MVVALSYLYILALSTKPEIQLVASDMRCLSEGIKVSPLHPVASYP